MAVVWIVVAVGLLAIELHHLAFFAMFGAAGALAAAGVAAVAPTAYVPQVAVGAAVALIGVRAVRPQISRAFASRRTGAIVHGVHGGLIGARGVALDDVSRERGGHVQLLGERWLAVTVGGETIAAATPVVVTHVAGTTLTVTAVEASWELT